MCGSVSCILHMAEDRNMARARRNMFPRRYCPNTGILSSDEGITPDTISRMMKNLVNTAIPVTDRYSNEC